MVQLQVKSLKRVAVFFFKYLSYFLVGEKKSKFKYISRSQNGYT